MSENRWLARLTALVLLLGAHFATALAQAGAPGSDPLAAFRFRSVGPAITSGRMADVAVDPRNPNIWYVASASGGLWKTTNRGRNFEPIFDSYPAYTMCCVLVDPRNSNVVWLATGENTNLRSAMAGNGIYRSSDAGRTWQHVGLGQSQKIGKMAFDPRNSDVLYVAAQGPLWASGGERGLYKTTNGGGSWERVLHVSEDTGISDVILDPRNPDVIYAASYQRRRNVGILIGGGPEGAIYKSENGGRDWRKLVNGLPRGDVGRIALGISPQNPDVLYASIAAKGTETGFYRSADRGETWRRMSGWIAGDPQYYGEIYPDPFKFDKVWAVAIQVMVTEDGGELFRQFATPGVHVDHHFIGFDARDTLYMQLGNDGGLYETYDGGGSWHHFRNLPVVQFYRIAVDNAYPWYNIYGGTQDNGSPGTPCCSFFPGGIRESEAMSVFGGDGFQPRVDPEDPGIIYAMSQDANIGRVDKRAGTSTSIRPPVMMPDSSRVRWHWDVPLIISPHSRTRLYTLGSRLFRSDNRGDDWRAVSPDITRQINRDTLTVMGRRWPDDAVWKNVYTNQISIGIALDESPLVEGLLYTGSDDGVVSVSEDGGQNWRTIERFPGVPEGTWVSELLASRFDANTVYAAFNGQWLGDFAPYLLKSSDRGRTWASISANLPEGNQVWTLAQDHVTADLIFAGTEHGVYVTRNGGQSWDRLRSGLPHIPVRDIEIQRRENDLVLGTFGRGIYILDDYSAFRTLRAQAMQQAGTLFAPRAAKLYNPVSYERGGSANGIFVGENPPFGAILTYHIGVGPAAGTEILLAVSDAGGQVVRELPAEAAVGTHRVVWNLRAVPPSAAGGRGGAVGRAGGRGGRGGRGGGRGGRGGGGTGPLVPAGTYTVQLQSRAGGQTTNLGGAQRLEVRALDR
jgi:photosystem II stability/assembly factor-like uncharacterized protein